MATGPTSTRAIDDYLTYLTVERGLSPATIRAYRGDLARLRGEPRRRRRLVPLAGRGVGYLAARTRRGRPRDPGLAPTSLRRRAASLKGFYRFAYGEGLIGIGRRRPPRPAAPDAACCPRRSTVEETERLLEAAGGDDPDEPGHDRQLRDRALLELLYAAGLRISEALRLDAEDLSTDGGFVRVIGKGDKERLVPVGDVALDWLARWMRRPAAAAAGPRPRRAGRAAARCSSATAADGSRGSRRGPRSRRRRGRPGSRTGSARTPCATRSRRICSRAEPTCASSRSCSDMRVSPRPSSTRI